MQACAVNVPGPQQRREFMAWTDDRLWLFDHVGRLTPRKCLAVCRYFADQLQGRHVFVDSFMKVCESEESMDEQKQLIGDMCDLAKETGLHLHVVRPGLGVAGMLAHHRHQRVSRDAFFEPQPEEGAQHAIERRRRARARGAAGRGPAGR